MKFMEGGPNGNVLLETSAQVVVMDSKAAGSGGMENSPIWHGRYGDGTTLQLDLVHTAAQSGLAKKNQPSYNLFHEAMHAAKGRQGQARQPGKRKYSMNNGPMQYGKKRRGKRHGKRRGKAAKAKAA
jgi:hypothetical protein